LALEEEAQVAAVSVFLFFVPFQISKRRRQRSREINSIRLEKVSCPINVRLRAINADLDRKNLDQPPPRFGVCRCARTRVFGILTDACILIGLVINAKTLG
jgi:hypothetical protein